MLTLSIDPKSPEAGGWRVEDALARASLLAILVAAPLLMGAVEGWALYPCWLLTFMVAASSAVRSLALGERFLSCSMPSLALLGALAVALVSAAGSIDPGLSILEWLRYLHVALFALLIRRRLCRPGDPLLVARGVVATGSIVAIYGLVETLTGSENLLISHKIHYVGELTGTFINHSHCAAALALALPIALALASDGTHVVERLAAGTLATTLCLALALTHSRAAWVALPAAAGLTLLALGRMPRARHVLLTALLALVSAGLFTALCPDRAGALIERLLTMSPSAPDSAGLYGRLALWRGAASLALTHPILGSGPATFEYACLPMRPLGYFYTLTRAHFDLLEAAAECGLPAAALLVTVIFALLSRVRQAARTGGSAPTDRLQSRLAAAFLVGALAAILHSCVDFIFHVPSLSLLAATLLAITWVRPPPSRDCPPTSTTSTSADPREPPRHSRVASPVPPPAFVPVPESVPVPACPSLLVGAVGVCFPALDFPIAPGAVSPAMTRVMSCSMTRVMPTLLAVSVAIASAPILVSWTLASGQDMRGRLLQRAGLTREAWAAYDRALSIRPDARGPLARAAALALDQARRFSLAGDAAATTIWASRAGDCAGRLTTAHPLDPQGWILEGQARAVLWLVRRHDAPALALADAARALACLRQAVSVDPHHHAGPVALGNFLFATGHYDESLQAFDEALRRYPSDRVGVFPEIVGSMAPAAALLSAVDLRSMDADRFALGLAIMRHRQRMAPADFRPTYDLQIIYDKRGLTQESRAAGQLLERLEALGAH